MILQALYEYYERKASNADNMMAPEGFEWKEIPFLIVIDLEGQFLRLEPTRQGDTKNKTYQSFLVPRGISRSGKNSSEIANLLWDHYGYVLGHPKKGKENENEKFELQAQKQHESFLQVLMGLPASLKQEAEIISILRFYQNKGITFVKNDPMMAEVEKIPGCNLSFRVEGFYSIAAENDVIKDYVAKLFAGEPTAGEDDYPDENIGGFCLVTGNSDTICRKHLKTPINKDNDSFISFQKNSGYDSYGKTQAYNAPVGKNAEFRYTNALRTLLAKESGNKMIVGDAVAVFWGEKQNGLEQRIKSIFSTPLYDKDDPDKGIKECRSALEWIRTGITYEETKTRFYILGLSPGGGSRISVRFWYQGTVAGFSRSIKLHFDDFEIVAPSFDKTWIGLKVLLKSISLKEEDDKLAPNLSSEISKAILLNFPYPESLIQQCMRRVRAEHFDDSRPQKQKYDKNGYLRAAILKACLNRKLRRSNPNNEKEITVSLDITNTNPGYRLGRLFAVLEKIQEDANPGINATIRDRFYGAASSNPVAVFPQLLKLKNHHLAKLDNQGFKIAHEKRLAEIMDGIGSEMPAHLTMDEQARFAIGYYHQRQAFFTKTDVLQGD